MSFHDHGREISYVSTTPRRVLMHGQSAEDSPLVVNNGYGMTLGVGFWRRYCISYKTNNNFFIYIYTL
jgi:hypothetical protein